MQKTHGVLIPARTFPLRRGCVVWRSLELPGRPRHGGKTASRAVSPTKTWPVRSEPGIQHNVWPQGGSSFGNVHANSLYIFAPYTEAGHIYSLFCREQASGCLQQSSFPPPRLGPPFLFGWGGCGMVNAYPGGEEMYQCLISWFRGHFSLSYQQEGIERAGRENWWIMSVKCFRRTRRHTHQPSVRSLVSQSLLDTSLPRACDFVEW